MITKPAAIRYQGPPCMNQMLPQAVIRAATDPTRGHFEGSTMWKG